MARRARRSIGSHVVSFKEAERLRDRMNVDEDKSSETLSMISRSLAVGLALITYTFFVQDNHSKFVAANFQLLLVASVLGVMALTADALHYLFAVGQVRLLRWHIKTHIARRRKLTYDALDSFNYNTFFYLRSAMFYCKLIFVALGTLVVITIIWWAASAPPPVTPA